MQLIERNKVYTSFGFLQEQIESPKPKKLTAQWVKVNSKLVCQWIVTE